MPSRDVGSLSAITFEMHAGGVYRHQVEPGIIQRGGRVDTPLAGLTLGAQLAWYQAQAATDTSSSAETSRRRASTSEELQLALVALDGAPFRIAARDWPAQLHDVAQAGLYSWWVDEGGASDLSRGLGHRVRTGRIYAGQTGATKWPSGQRGKATLTSRIGGNHLRGQINGSTFRLTLASILADRLGLERGISGRLDRVQEQRLSTWMCDHLQVAVHPFVERDALGDLEHLVLNTLDPPLNLDGRPPTPLRTTLTRLRSGRA
jgi:hypothetical protein